MTYTGQNLELYRGKDRIIEVTIYDSAGAPLSIGSHEFTWVVYKPTTALSGKYTAVSAMFARFIERVGIKGKIEE